MTLGLSLRAARQRAGLSLRELARRLGVSPSLLSQIENGRSQPSVATLYALAKALQVSIDDLFQGDAVKIVSTEQAGTTPTAAAVAATTGGGEQPGAALPLTESRGNGFTPIRRSSLGSIRDIWKGDGESDRVSITSPGDRTRLVMDTGVVWEQLATNTAHQVDFMEILYPPGSSSTSDNVMLQHDGFEYGYLLEGELEVTHGFDVLTLKSGQAIGLNSSIPHLLRNRGSVPARGLWFVHHRHA